MAIIHETNEAYLNCAVRLSRHIWFACSLLEIGLSSLRPDLREAYLVEHSAEADNEMVETHVLVDAGKRMGRLHRMWRYIGYDEINYNNAHR